MATQDFCDRYVDFRLDPRRRLYDQMTQAARSIRANIAEGSGRHDTSLQTEMRLTDVARASAHELLVDYSNEYSDQVLLRMGFHWPVISSTYVSHLVHQLEGLGFFL